MDEKRIRKLVAKLGMTEHLEPMFYDDDTFTKFEDLIDRCITPYENRRVVLRAVDFPPRYEIVGKSTHYSHGIPRYKGGIVTQRDLGWFKQYYGIGQRATILDEIAATSGVTKQSVHNRLDFVVGLLAQKHKSDIWYGML